MNSALRKWLSFLLVATAWCFGVDQAKNPVRDFSKEGFVIERSSDKVKFENDGTYMREISARIKIQSDAGLQRYSVVRFAFQNSLESFNVDYVRVVKPDGTTVVTPSDIYQDMPSDVTRAAPFYSDEHEMQIAVKGLSVGDVLEYQAHWEHNRPLVPGQFWFANNFADKNIVLQETLEISIPHGRKIKLKSPEVSATVSHAGSYDVYTWTSSNLADKDEKAEKQEQLAALWREVRGRHPQPDVLLSSFESWQQLGDWYRKLQSDRVQPSPEIQAKAAELTKGLPDEDAKIRALYDFVSTKYRYIGIAFGIGRYQPHAAAEVLANQYGDCKDKHTLFASLLAAAGIPAYPALISSIYEVDSDVPSPGQFDHVITAIPRKTGYLWLDTTAEIAPFALLMPPIRDKHALVMPEDRPAELALTPADAPFPSVQRFEMDAKLTDGGVLEGKAEDTERGDTELPFRGAFRMVPVSRWKDLVQRVSYGLGFAGDVSEVTASQPEKTSEPFHVSYSYSRKDYSDWGNRRITPPLPPITMREIPDDVIPTAPLWLGSPGEIIFHATLQLPKGYIPNLPRAVHLKQDFADYDSTYAFSSGVITADRHLTIRLREIPASEYKEYKSFRKAIEDDYGTYTSLSVGTSASTSGNYQEEIWNLPYSSNPEAARFYDDARAAYQRNDTQAEISLLKRAVEVDPKFVRAWLWLGEIYKYSRQTNLALESYRKAIEIDHEQPVSYKALSQTLLELGRWNEAIPILQQLVKIAPNQSYGFSQLGATLLTLKRYRDAIPPLEAAAKLAPNQSGIQLNLGRAYAGGGDLDSARASFDRVLALDPSPVMLNDIAFELAEQNADLNKALEYSKKAVTEEENGTQKLDIAALQQEDLAHPNRLAAFWDTLGWVYYRMDDLTSAESYLNAAWLLSQRHTVGEHLGRVYEKQTKKAKALSMYRVAYANIPATMGPGFQTQKVPAFASDVKTLEEDMKRLGETPKPSVFPADLNEQRTVKLSRLVSGTASAEFFVVFGPGKKVEAKFISGSDALKGATKELETAKFNVPFPDEHPTKILRRGILACYPSSGCNFVMMPTSAAVFSVQ